jgi:predicted nuclease of predicted toxin-antitoxin system
MRFLVDAQLPPALARWLSDQGHQAEHVFDLGFVQASDREIWMRAVATRATIITKDQDFVVLRSLDPDGAAVVWVRIGNTTRRRLLALFAQALPPIERALASGETLVEVTE